MDATSWRAVELEGDDTDDVRKCRSPRGDKADALDGGFLLDVLVSLGVRRRAMRVLVEGDEAYADGVTLVGQIKEPHNHILQPVVWHIPLAHLHHAPFGMEHAVCGAHFVGAASDCRGGIADIGSFDRCIFLVCHHPIGKCRRWLAQEVKFQRIYKNELFIHYL